MTSTDASGRTLAPAMSWASYAVLALGAAGSLAMMFWTGRHQPSVILIALFTGWVGSPFVGVALAALWPLPWLAARRRRLRGLMIAVGLGSPVIYGVNTFIPFSPRAAAIFLIVPAFTWVLITIGMLVPSRRPRS